MRRLGDRGSNLSSFVENIVRQHLEEYGEDIEKWEKTVSRKEKVDGFLGKGFYPFFKIGLPFEQIGPTFSSSGLVLCENTTNAVSHRMHGIRF